MRGVRIYLATPRLRGLLALNLSFAAAGATDVAIALGRFGGGSMVAALLLPRILDRLQDRRVMLPAAAFLAGVLFVLAVLVCPS
jgi:predicted MFS family arabinose efflux permease